MEPIKEWRLFSRISRSILIPSFLLACGAMQPIIASAATITVHSAIDIPFLGGPCNLRQAIESHNTKHSPGGSGCTTGSGSDTIVLDIIGNTIDLGSPLQPITGALTIKPKNNNVCYNLRQSTYMTVTQGSSLTLLGISVVVNGAEPLSVIDNNGGTLIVGPNGDSGPCLLSNQNGIERKPRQGGILFNRNNGTTTIQDASFNSSSASENGGAIYVDSGIVNIERGNYISNNSGGDGGAIWLNNGATLNIQSSNFSMNSNTAGGSGGAIYSNGGKVSIQRATNQTLGNVSISSNKGANGGAIYANGGTLSIDGIQFLSNSTTGSGGAIQLTNVIPPSPASITRSYFRQNSASVKGASIYATGGSTMNLSGDTFLRNRGGLYIDSLTTLGMINSTFLGATGTLDGITVASGTADVTFSTLLASSLTGPPSSALNLSSSLLREVTCSNVTDGLNNLRTSSSLSCPGTESTNPTLGLDPSFLANNGGFTPTITLVAGSPARDAISKGDCVDLSNHPLTIDQRDAVRPDPTKPTFCDTGAVESESKATPGQLPPGTPLN